MPPMDGSSTADAQPRFYYDLASPEAYLVAERALHALGEVPEWIPVRDDGLAFRCAAEVDAYQEDVERRAAALGLMALRWPDPFPADTDWAMLAATYAKVRSAAAWRSRWPRSGRRSPPGATSPSATAC